MKKTNLDIPGLFTCEPQKLVDERGFFMERGKVSAFEELGLNNFVQDNFSRSAKGVLRGIHYQYQPAQGKLVTCTRGRILDVVVDLRFKSATFGQINYLELDGDYPTWLWVPSGFGHGFIVLSDEGADLWYKVDQYYNSKGENGIRWDDPDLNINWKVNRPLVSPKDAVLGTFASYRVNPEF